MLSKMYFYSVVRKKKLSICMTFWNLQQIIRLQMQNGMGRIYFHSCWRCSGSDVKAESRHEAVVMMAPHPASVALLYFCIKSKVFGHVHISLLTQRRIILAPYLRLWATDWCSKSQHCHQATTAGSFSLLTLNCSAVSCLNCKSLCKKVPDISNKLT